MSRPATLGPGRLICVDGPAGSGKTTLATALAEMTHAPVVHMDDLYAGWDGLTDGIAQLETILLPLVEGSPGSYRRYDWHAREFAETVLVPPSPLLVIEGFGSGAATYDGFRTALAWVDAPEEERHHGHAAVHVPVRHRPRFRRGAEAGRQALTTLTPDPAARRADARRRSLRSETHAAGRVGFPSRTTRQSVWG